MKRFYFLLVAFFVCHLHAGASSVKEDPEVQPIQVTIGDSNVETSRTVSRLEIECWYIPTSNSFLFNSFSPISNVEVTIENFTTGELIQEEYSVIAGQVSIPAISTKGTFVIELIINNNEVYIGELKL